MTNKKHIIVTGNLGFIGSWVSLALLRLGYKVIGIDDLSSLGSRMANEVSLQDKMEEQFDFNITETEKLIETISKYKPVAIINLAGQAIVPRAFKDPIMTFKSNTLGTLSVLEAARQTNSLSSVVCITSDKVYENTDQIWPYRESDKLGGKDIYSVSKSAAELLVSAYASTHLKDTNTNIQTVRLGNVVGGGDWSINRLIPDFMCAIIDDKTFYIRYPQATRPFQHILDVVDGILNVLEASIQNKVKTGEGWNLGPKNNTVAKVVEIVDECKKLWPQIKIEQTSNQIKEDLNLSVEVIKYTKRFSSPRHTSSEAIKSTVQWYKSYFEGKDLNFLIENEFTMHEEKEC